MEANIKYILDKDGNIHELIPIDHAHTINDINGLQFALNGKADNNHQHYQLVDNEGNTLSLKMTSGVPSLEANLESMEGGSVQFEITPSNVGNLNRALTNPDTIPTLNSNKLVTSGGVKTALDGKANAAHNHEKLQTSYGHVGIVHNDFMETTYLAVELSSHDGDVEFDVTPSNVSNLHRALRNSDTVPTINSDNLVTSGAIATALGNKANKSDFTANKTGDTTITGLNNITIPGIYFGNVNNDDNEIGAILIVSNGLQGDSCYQTLITGTWAQSTSNIEYYTRYNGGSWSAWTKKTIQTV